MQITLKSIRVGPYGVHNVHSTCGLKLLTSLRLGLSHVYALNFNDNFCEILSKSYTCGTNPVDTRRPFNVYKTSLRRRRRSRVKKSSP